MLCRKKNSWNADMRASVSSDYAILITVFMNDQQYIRHIKPHIQDIKHRCVCYSMHALIIHQSPKLASLRQWAWWWKLSLHLITQYSRVFSSGYGAYSVCVYQYQKFVTDTSPTRLTFSSVRLGAVNRQGLPFFDCVSMIRRYCKHIGAADAYRALLGTDEIHCLRSLILETIVERMYRRSWQLVQQTVALVCQPYV